MSMMKSNDNRTATIGSGVKGAGFSAPLERVVLPLPPQNTADAKFEMDVYARFMRHLRSVPNNRMEIKVFSAITFTADMMDVQDALVSKILVDLGLKAPRNAFPASFLEFADLRLMRAAQNGEESTQDKIVKLRAYWDDIGEDRFAHVMAGRYSICNMFDGVDA